MGRYTGPLCRLCRTEGTKLYLKGQRCTTEKCSLERRKYPPGAKGSKVSFRKSNYKVQLREKQKVKRFYGVAEKQFRNFFTEASRQKGITGENLLQSLELRLDNVIYRMNLAASRAHARQLIRHGHIEVNGHKVTIPSYILRQNDELGLRERAVKNEKLQAMLEGVRGLVDVPEWIVMNDDKVKGRINSLPGREDVRLEVEEHLIVELYSK